MKAKLLFFVAVLFSFFTASTKLHAQANPSNPYDEVGVTHNYVLGSFLNEYSKERMAEEQMNEQKLYNYICQKARIQQCDFLQQLRAGEMMQVTKTMDLFEAVDYLQAKGYISSTFAEYAIAIGKSIQNNMATGYDAIYVALITLEREITNTRNLKEAERAQLLQACAVGRYSAKFWSDLSNGVTSYAGVSHASLSTQAASSVANEDVKGAISGAVGGAIAGASAGGVGAGPGALVGAVGGGLGASVADAAVKLWNWFWS